jgi:ABC-type Mn2+/Zn2+ transport system permease subunit
VGNILVVAMLIVPAAAAHMLTDRLSAMILVSAIIGALAAVLVPRALKRSWDGK